MNITLEHFRTQIGNLNYGSVIVDSKTESLKTVNNGWFARHCSMFFATRTTVAQNQEAAVKLYQAVKNSVTAEQAAGTTEFLRTIAAQFGVRVEGEQVTATLTTPLSRRTIKEVVHAADNFKLQLFADVKAAANELVVNMAQKLVTERNETERMHVVGSRRVLRGSHIRLEPILEWNEGAVPFAPILNAEHGLQFLRESLAQGAIRGRETRSNVTVLINDMERLASLHAEQFASTEEMVTTLEGNLGSRKLNQICRRAVTGVNLLKKEIWKSDVLLKYFREKVGDLMRERAEELGLVGAYRELSTETLQRLVNRHFVEIVSRATSESQFSYESEAYQTKYLAEFCVAAMSDLELSA